MNLQDWFRTVAERLQSLLPAPKEPGIPEAAERLHSRQQELEARLVALEAEKRVVR